MNSLFDDETITQISEQNGRIVYSSQANIHLEATADVSANTESLAPEDQTLTLFEVAPDTTLKRKSVSIVSPLRYPGSKRRFACYIAESLKINGIRPRLFVEPFAGGASVALQMLADNLVDKIGIGELDPLIADFWHCVFFDSKWLIESIKKLDVSIETWHYYKAFKPSTRRDRALTCLFLNRTNFSGILKAEAGPIGGISQASEYDIACRFTKETIINRITKAASYKDRVEFVWNESWEDTIKYSLGIGYKPKDIFVYLDPPFYYKADALYRHHFLNGDHRHLRDGLRGFSC